MYNLSFFHSVPGVTLHQTMIVDATTIVGPIVSHHGPTLGPAVNNGQCSTYILVDDSAILPTMDGIIATFPIRFSTNIFQHQASEME